MTDEPQAPTEMIPAQVSFAARFQPHDLRQMAWLANQMVASRLFAGMTQSQALTVMLAGAELGVMSVQALRAIYIIEGKPVLSADLKVALCKRHPECKYFRMVESTSEKATFETWRSSDPKPTTLTVTIDQFSHLAHKTNWKQNPAAMLRARCKSQLASTVYEDLFLGVYSEEETEEMGPRHAIDVTPQELSMPPVVDDAGEVDADEAPKAEASASEPSIEPTSTDTESSAPDTKEAPAATEPEKPKRARPPVVRPGGNRPEKPQEPQGQVIEGTAKEVPATPPPPPAPAPAPSAPPAPSDTAVEIRKILKAGNIDKQQLAEALTEAGVTREQLLNNPKGWVDSLTEDQGMALLSALLRLPDPLEDALATA